jgi:transcriptional regulator with XRE-family HTH domain
MPRKRTLTPGASPLHHFGSELRRALEEAGMTLSEFGALVPCDNSTVSRIEAGLIAPDLHFAEVADRAFPFARGWFTRFFHDSANWTESSAFAAEFRDFADDELEATALYTFEHSVLPGLLQTEDYARAVLSRHPGVTAELVNSRVAARLGRQAVLTGDDPPLLWAVLDEMTLRRQYGSPKIMRDALLHLADMARLPNVTVQVIPVRGQYHVGLQGSINIAEKSGALASVFVGDADDGRTSDDPGMVNRLSVRFRHLQTVAMTPDESLGLLERIAETHEHVAQVELQRQQRQRLRRGRPAGRHRAGTRHHRPRGGGAGGAGRRVARVRRGTEAALAAPGTRGRSLRRRLPLWPATLMPWPTQRQRPGSRCC